MKAKKKTRRNTIGPQESRNIDLKNGGYQHLANKTDNVVYFPVKGNPEYLLFNPLDYEKKEKD